MSSSKATSAALEAPAAPPDSSDMDGLGARSVLVDRAPGDYTPRFVPKGAAGSSLPAQPWRPTTPAAGPLPFREDRIVFTGLVETQGRLIERQARGAGADLVFDAPVYAGMLSLGESIAINGVCLSVVRHDGAVFAVNAIEETLRRTTLGDVAVGGGVNLERALQLGDRLGGHLVSGHVDGVAVVRERHSADYGEAITLELPAELARYVAPKGSVALDGISLTVGEVDGARFRIYLIPHTLAVTTASGWVPGARVNVEVDVISRYVERLLQPSATTAS